MRKVFQNTALLFLLWLQLFSNQIFYLKIACGSPHRSYLLEFWNLKFKTFKTDWLLTFMHYCQWKNENLQLSWKQLVLEQNGLKFWAFWASGLSGWGTFGLWCLFVILRSFSPLVFFLFCFFQKVKFSKCYSFSYVSFFKQTFLYIKAAYEHDTKITAACRWVTFDIEKVQ